MNSVHSSSNFTSRNFFGGNKDERELNAKRVSQYYFYNKYFQTFKYLVDGEQFNKYHIAI